MEIFIADDDRVSLALINKLVRSKGFVPRLFKNGEDLLKAMTADLSDKAPAMALLDWEMPGMTGPEVCQRIREHFVRNPPYVILLTGRDKPDDLVRGLRSGANDYITKPFSPEEVLARLEVGVRTLELQEDLSRANQALIHSEKMASVGRLAAGAAHEINNPLGFIRSNLGHLSKLCNQLYQFAASVQSSGVESAELRAQLKALELEYIAEDLQDIETETQAGLSRISDIVNELSRFADKTQMVIQPCDLSELIPQTFNGVPIHFARDLKGLPQVSSDPTQLRCLIESILDNAVQATVSGGRISVDVEPQEDSLALIVRDTGVGMSAEVLSHATGPFFTTREPGHGKGLGLTTAHNIARQSGGDLTLVSKLGAGTKVVVRLPIWSESD